MMTTNDALERTVLLAIANAGERMVPEISDGSTFWEHVYRYAFARRFVKGKQVLDVACGEGYGAAALRRAGAARVIGVDISEDACRHARQRYGLDARASSAEKIPLANASIDVVISFETIEHVPDPISFLDECTRVLKSEGKLIISTPNKAVYSGPGQPSNPHHCSEMTEDEFLSALRSRFQHIKLYSQHPHWAPWWSLRTLSADESPWDRVPLFRRLRRSAQFRLFPVRLSGPSPEQRSTAVEQVLHLRRTWYSPLFPYAVRPLNKRSRERSFYFVATATSPRRPQAQPTDA